MSEAPPLLDVRDLKTHFRTRHGAVQAVNGVSFAVREGETLGLVGESGCGKSVTALSLMRLVPSPGRVVGGEVWFEGRDLAALSESEMRAVRGSKIAMIFQDPTVSLNPVLTIGRQITETLELHAGFRGNAARKRAIELLEMVGIPSPGTRIDDYPHQLSGGMRQRAMIAMALSCEPRLLIADEPTTALDVTVQDQVLELLERLQRVLGMALILITHDLSVVAGIAQRVSVMYAGYIVELAPTEELFSSPRHPYTVGLLRSVPRITEARAAKLEPIDGVPPNMLNPLPGCPFSPRCKYAQRRCLDENPRPMTVGKGHQTACWEWTCL